MSLIKIKYFDKAEDFLNTLRKSNDIWWNENGNCEWIFRGIGNANDWKLIPNAWRKHNNKLEPLYQKLKELPFVEYECQEQPREPYMWLNAELEAIHQFIHEASRKGHNVDIEHINYSPLFHKNLFGGREWGKYKKCAPIAQHHGIPTRLLDWTYNPLFACFFASSEQFTDINSESLCVWAFNTEIKPEINTEVNGLPINPIIIKQEPYKNKYLYSQEGLFMEFGNAEHFYNENNRWPSLEDYVDQPCISSDKEILIKHVLPSTERIRLCQLLDREGASLSALMPTLDNIAQMTIKKW